MNFNRLLTEAVTRTPKSMMESWLGKVHTGDCVELMDKMPVGSIDLIVTSPPYNIKNSTGNGLKNGRAAGSGRKPSLSRAMRPMTTPCLMMSM